MDAMNGVPFWVIRKEHLMGEYDYNIWHIKKYLYHNYPIIDITEIQPNFQGRTYTVTKNISLALVRQLNDLDEDSWAFWDSADVERALMILKLKGFTINPDIIVKGDK